ncbi:pyridoxal phosphate synthase yaaE subunit [Acetitomaculum ruminis DSM 5522]|uniref:Pyridoxal 5'-phosphate synthase subunit PdxT n=1 Tax=Acetitomaculum ruminis DSM 5522 TaxID=1120918 RepID=A0A1I0XHS7_9FIRM|nr:pyridoxal 5'-phosphate synthase glutaminase subunit PdxT [Acetitomaculum ruminis]SFB00227.1 pyridoxal phosphate synthase yaaE subunit [Acetitomaculum ruminis DSM 5522]
MKIGVLAVQGAFIEHKNIIEKLGVKCVEIRQKKDFKDIDGLILPGGESTVQGKLLHKLDMFNLLKKEIENGLPTLATCAGLILLADKIENQKNNHLATLPVKVKRNAYGRQLGSFITKADVGHLNNFPQVFIRAPYITDVYSNVSVLSKVDEKIVAVKYKNQIGLSFHPEMTDDYRIHQKLLEMAG